MRSTIRTHSTSHSWSVGAKSGPRLGARGLFIVRCGDKCRPEKTGQGLESEFKSLTVLSHVPSEGNFEETRSLWGFRARQSVAPVSLSFYSFSAVKRRSSLKAIRARVQPLRRADSSARHAVRPRLCHRRPTRSPPSPEAADQPGSLSVAALLRGFIGGDAPSTRIMNNQTSQ